MDLDMKKLEPLLGTMVNEIGAAGNALLVLIGDKLGLYRALAAGSPLTSTELATQTGTHCARPWPMTRPRRQGRTSATCASGWRRRPRPGS